MKLDPNKNDYEQELFWVAHPTGVDNDPQRQFLADHRYAIDIIGWVKDEDAGYEYDEIAIIKLGKKYYMLQTSGCSCPSPSETWHIVEGPTTLRRIRKSITSGKYEGYTLPGKKEKELLTMIDLELR